MSSNPGNHLIFNENSEVIPTLTELEAVDLVDLEAFHALSELKRETILYDIVEKRKEAAEYARFEQEYLEHQRRLNLAGDQPEKLSAIDNSVSAETRDIGPVISEDTLLSKQEESDTLLPVLPLETEEECNDTAELFSIMDGSSNKSGTDSNSSESSITGTMSNVFHFPSNSIQTQSQSTPMMMQSTGILSTSSQSSSVTSPIFRADIPPDLRLKIGRVEMVPPGPFAARESGIRMDVAHMSLGGKQFSCTLDRPALNLADFHPKSSLNAVIQAILGCLRNHLNCVRYGFLVDSPAGVARVLTGPDCLLKQEYEEGDQFVMQLREEVYGEWLIHTINFGREVPDLNASVQPSLAVSLQSEITPFSDSQNSNKPAQSSSSPFSFQFQNMLDHRESKEEDILDNGPLESGVVVVDQSDPAVTAFVADVENEAPNEPLTSIQSNSNSGQSKKVESYAQMNARMAKLMKVRNRKKKSMSHHSIWQLHASAIKRLARRAGVVRMNPMVYDEIRDSMYHFLRDRLKTAITYTDHARRKTVTAMDVVRALKKHDCQLYGFGIEEY